MDYNGGVALTPCQLNIEHQQLRNYYGAYTLCNTGCEPTHAFFSVPECVHVNANNQAQGLIMDARGSWIARSAVNANNAQHTVYLYEVDANNVLVPGTFTNATTYSGEPGLLDLGALYSLLPNRRYAAYLSVSSNCYGSSAVRYFNTSSSFCEMVWTPGRAATPSVELFPNPTTTGTFSVKTTASAPVRVTVRDTYGKAVAVQLLSADAAEAHPTSHVSTYLLPAAKPGLYLVEITDGEQRTVRRLEITTP